MADEKKEETPTEEEKKEDSPESPGEQEEQPSEEKEEKEEKKSKNEDENEDEVEEPKTRFPKEKDDDGKEDQGSETKRLGYKMRKYKKKLIDAGIEPDEGDDDEEDYKDEDDRPVTKGELKKMLSEKEKGQASDEMLDDFIEDNPEYAKFKKKIKAHLNHPDYRNVPIGFIADGVAGKEVEKEMQKKREKADEEAEETSSGGSSNRQIPGKKGKVWNLSKEEFEQKKLEVLQKGRN